MKLEISVYPITVRQIDDYATAREITRSDAARQLIHRGATKGDGIMGAIHVQWKVMELALIQLANFVNGGGATGRGAELMKTIKDALKLVGDLSATSAGHEN